MFVLTCDGEKNEGRKKVVKPFKPMTFYLLDVMCLASLILTSVNMGYLSDPHGHQICFENPHRHHYFQATPPWPPIVWNFRTSPHGESKPHCAKNITWWEILSQKCKICCCCFQKFDCSINCHG